MLLMQHPAKAKCSDEIKNKNTQITYVDF